MTPYFPCTFSRWSPGLGDNHLVGWVTVFVYAIAAVGCILAASRGRFPAETIRRERLFWWMASALLFFLAVNKQLDLQSLLTAAGRCIALEQGWYDDRRTIQRRFIIAVVLTGSAAFVVLGALLRGTYARTSLALVGLGLVTLFVAIRAASFHQVDALINTWVLGVRLNWLFELPGPLLVLVAAIRTRLLRRT